MALAGLWLALLVGCGGEGASEDPGSQTQDVSALASPLIYQRSGGLAGRTSEMRLQPDGRARFATEGIGEHTARLRPAELEKVERLLARVDLARMPDEFVEPEPHPDTFSHRVTYRGNTVATGSDAGEPEELGALNNTLSGLFDRYAPKRR